MENLELDEVQWRSPEWIQFNGLRTDNVLEYFALSPFYDRSSNNQVLKMQTNFNEQFQSRPADPASELKKMKGVEYQIILSREPDLWVIRKQFRRSPTEVDTLAVYFVSGENIYQSPSVYNVLVSRLLATSKYLEEAFSIAEKLPEFNFSGYDYQRLKPHAESPPPASENTETARDVYIEKLHIPNVLENSLALSLQQLHGELSTKDQSRDMSMESTPAADPNQKA